MLKVLSQKCILISRAYIYLKNENKFRKMIKCRAKLYQWWSYPILNSGVKCLRVVLSGSTYYQCRKLITPISQG